MSRRALLAWFALVLALGVFSRWYVQERRPTRCSLDGGRIEPIYRVDLVVDGSVRESFCGVRCATEWPRVPAGAAWHVRDEVSGRTIDAGKASFVESSVVTVAARQDRTHVFEHWPEASEHAAEYGGNLLANPFARKRLDAAEDDETD